MAVVVVASSTGTTTAALPAGTVSGDLVVAFAYASTTTAPTLPASWTNIVNNATTMATRVQWRIYDGAWAMPTFTGAAQTHAITLRGHDPVTPIGVTSISNANQSNVVWPTVTLVDASGSSRLLRGVGHTRPDSVITAPTGHTSLQAAGTQPGYLTCTKTTTTDGLTATSTISRNTTWTQTQVEVHQTLAPITQAAAALTAVSTLSVTGTSITVPQQQATAALTAVSTLTATAVGEPQAAASLTASSTLSVNATASSGAFDPSTLPGLVVWLDAADLSSIGSAWTDKSGTGHHGTIVGAPAPTIRTNALNGKSVVRFAANEGRVRGTGTGVTYDHTLVYVTRLWGPNVGRSFTCQYPPSNFLVGFHSSAQDCMYDNGWLKNDVGYAGSPGPWKMYGCDGVLSPAYVVRFFINGVVSGTGATGGGMGGTYNLSGYEAVGAQETMDCEVAELVIYDHKLTDAERIQVESYLSAKWLATGPATITASANLTATSTLTATGLRESPAAVALTAASSLVATGVRQQPATSSLSATSTLAATANRAPQAAAGLSATSTLIATATQAGVQAGAVGLAASSTLSATAVRSQALTAALSASSTLIVGTVRAPQGVAALAAGSTLTATAVRATLGSASLVSVSTLATAAIKARPGAVALVTGSILIATGDRIIKAGVSNAAHTGHLYALTAAGWGPVATPV